MIIGAQLYSVCVKCDSGEGIRETLKALSEMGYRSIQVSGFKYDPHEVRRYADEFGLHIGLTHTSVDEIINNTDEVIARHKALGVDMIGVGAPSEKYASFTTGEFNYEDFLRDMLPATKKIQDAGFDFGYHNHYIEFKDLGGFNFMDLIYEKTDWKFILDTGWVDFSGFDAVSLIHKYKDRLKYVHLKDFRPALETDKSMIDRIVPLYKGAVPIDDIVKALIEVGTCEVAYVEQDNASYKEDPYAEMKISFDALSQHGWV